MIDLSWIGEFLDLRDITSGVVSCFLRFIYQGRITASGSPIAARMNNRLNVLSDIANLLEVISKNSMTAKQVARYAINMGITFLRLSSCQNFVILYDDWGIIIYL
jgi:hypothetical protein